MHELYQTYGAGDLKTHTAKAFKLAEKGPVLILSRQQPKGVLVNPDQWNAMAARLKMLEAIHEARKIEALANEAGTWIPWEQTKAGMKIDGTLAD